MKVAFTVYALIRRPVRAVFDAVYNPRKLSAHFTTGGASGPLETGKTVTWDFADFPGAFPVHVQKTIRHRRIVLRWKAVDGDYQTTVTFAFRSLGARVTKVEISETGWRDTPKGRAASYGNCFGWTQMLCGLKLYVERGINLRDGFFT